jgi:hypothetical protein
MGKGWIYLRHDPGRAYCFGKTNSIKRRDKEYRKENPFVVKIDAFFTSNMSAAEDALILLTSHIRLRGNSREWIKHTNEMLTIWRKVKARHADDRYAESQRTIVALRRAAAAEKEAKQKLEAEAKRTAEMVRRQAEVAAAVPLPERLTRPERLTPQRGEARNGRQKLWVFAAAIAILFAAFSLTVNSGGGSPEGYNVPGGGGSGDMAAEEMARLQAFENTFGPSIHAENTPEGRIRAALRARGGNGSGLNANTQILQNWNR